MVRRDEEIYRLFKRRRQRYKQTLLIKICGLLSLDFHRNLLYGGIFIYPADKKTKTEKLRLMYEANPLAFYN